MPRLTLKQLDDHVLIAEGQLASLFLASDRMYAQIQDLTQLAARQAETIAELTELAEELAKSHNALRMLEMKTFTLAASTASRADTHGAWIRDLYNRINKSE